MSRPHSGFSLLFYNPFRNCSLAWASKCYLGHKRGIWRNHSHSFWWSFWISWTYSRPASAAACGCSKWGWLCWRSRRRKCIIHPLLTKHLKVFPHCARTKEIFYPSWSLLWPTKYMLADKECWRLHEVACKVDRLLIYAWSTTPNINDMLRTFERRKFNFIIHSRYVTLKLFIYWKTY